MKKLTMLLSLFAATAMISCSTDDLDGMSGGSGANGSQSEETALVSVKIATKAVTRAAATGSGSGANNDQDDTTVWEPGDGGDGGTLAGSSSVSLKDGSTVDENNILESNVALIGFDGDGGFIAYYTPKAVEGTGGAAVYEFEVAPNVENVLAVCNTLPQEGVPNFSALQKLTALNTQAVDWKTGLAGTPVEITVADAMGGLSNNKYNAFIMTTPGSSSSMYDYIGKLKTSVDDDGNKYKNTAKLTVDRAIAKFNYKYDASTFTAPQVNPGTENADLDAKATILGSLLTAKNKSMYICSEVLVETSGEYSYRKDPNMSITAVTMEDEKGETVLAWLKNNNDEENFEAKSEPGNYEYVLENTAEPAYYDSNNLTQAVVKAKYYPIATSLIVDCTTEDDKLSFTRATARDTDACPDSGKWKSWFAINVEGDKYFTFAGVQAYYKWLRETTDASNNPIADNIAIADKMDAQLKHILGSAKTWSAVTLDELDKIANGGYKAATVEDEENYIVQYFQNSLTYYDVFIQHDSSVPIGNRGRWGMVRNNSYTLNLNSVKGPGLPYIPDPTDPEITDPKNPDPENPDPADLGTALLDVTIEVNSWTTWQQNADLDQDQSGDYGKK